MLRMGYGEGERGFVLLDLEEGVLIVGGGHHPCDGLATGLGLDDVGVKQQLGYEGCVMCVW